MVGDKVNAKVFKLMGGGSRLFEDADVHTQLFHQFALQAGLRCFAGLQFASREFPVAGVLLVRCPTCNEVLVFSVADDTADNGDQRIFFYKANDFFLDGSAELG